MITNFLFVQKMRKIIVSEILNQMSEGLFNSNYRPRKTASSKFQFLIAWAQNLNFNLHQREKEDQKEIEFFR